MPRVAAAQNITIDGRFSPAQTLVGPNYSISANLGKQVGSNLFHSFGQFSLSTPEKATFSGPATISNVIGRVTGGNPSSIDGGIQSTVTGANLYLINPSGIVFGPNATVNVSGSFHASTADYLKMADGAGFQATNPDGSTLSAAPPAAFGFLTASPAAINVNGSTLGPVPGTLGLVGGPTSISGAALSAPAGTIHVTGVAGTGEVPIDPRNTPALTVTNFGLVGISGGSKLDVSDPRGRGSGGSIFLRAGALTIDAAEVNADNYGAGAGGQLVLRGDGQITLSNSAAVHAASFGIGGGGSVIVTAQGSLALSDRGTGIIASATLGPGGSVSIDARSLTITGGAQIASSTNGPGRGGDVNITVASDIVLPDRGPQITARSTGRGDAGSIAVSAARLLMNNGAAISTEAETSTASGGNITLKVRDFLYLTSSEITTSVKGETGNGGNIVIIGSQLAILNHSSIIGQAINGHGGNLLNITGVFIPSSDSIIGGSQLGIVDANGALVTLRSELRAPVSVLLDSCAAQGSRPRSSLVGAGPIGVPQDPNTTLASLYLGGRDRATGPAAVLGSPTAAGPPRAALDLTVPCE
jgi:filamentous hemagglutinin family protein